MKNISRIVRVQMILLLTGVLFSSCNDSMVNEEKYAQPKESEGFIVGEGSTMLKSSVEVNNTGSTTLYFSLTKEAEKDINATFTIDEQLLKSYNTANGTSYKLFPKEQVTLENGGNVTIAKGKQRSNPIKVSLRTNGATVPRETYVVPVSVKANGLVLSNEASGYLIFVNGNTNVLKSSTTQSVKVISITGTSVNPLNNLCFTLKKSGKPLADIVIIFSANINYNSETGKVFVYKNNDVTQLLENKEKYIKPLQDRGIKVLLSILGNWDISGISNLAPQTAKEFANELKTVCNTYNLDGVFFDDEYSSYKYVDIPQGFVYPSNSAAARLVYETKQAMPNKIVSVYVYGNTSSFESVDGIQPGSFVDYAIHDYGQQYNLGSSFPGLQKSGMALSSQEFANDRYASKASLQYIRQNGYGAHMFFDMDPFRGNFSRQRSAMELIARVFFDDELVYNGNPYPRDWSR